MLCENIIYACMCPYLYMPLCDLQVIWRVSNVTTMSGNQQGPWYQILLNAQATLYSHDQYSHVAFNLHSLSITEVNIPSQLMPRSSASAFNWNNLHCAYFFLFVCWPKYLFEMKSWSLCWCLFTIVNVIVPDYQTH